MSEPAEVQLQDEDVSEPEVEQAAGDPDDTDMPDGLLGLLRFPSALWHRITLNESRSTRAAIAGKILSGSAAQSDLLALGNSKK